MFMSNNTGRKFQNSLKRLENGLAEKVENGSAQLSSGFSTITNLVGYLREAAGGKPGEELPDAWVGETFMNTWK